MIKQTVLLTLALIGSGSLFGQTNILNEDFETGIPSNWTIYVNDAGVMDTTVYEYAPGWIAVQDPDNPSDTVAAASSFFTTNTQASRWLVTPALNLTSYGNFIKWQTRSFDPSYPDTYLVLVSTTDNQLASFTDTIGYVEYEWEDWTEREVNLTGLGYANQTIYVAFILRTTQGFKLFLNDVQARVDDPLGLSETAQIDVKLFPNPTTDQLNIQCPATVNQLRIMNLSGQEVYTQQNPASAIAVSDLAPGMYLIHLKTALGTVVKRFEKR